MAAPNGTIWGSTVGDYGRIGLYITTENTDTQTTVTVEVWFASKYSVSDSNNTFYYDIGYKIDSGQATTDKGSVSVSTSVNSGSGWSTTNQIKLKTYTATYTRANSTATKYIYAKLKDIDRVGGTMLVSTTTTIPGLDSYTVSYNANGGSGAPSAQTKYYGKNLTLSSSKPTRTGHTFQKWNTKSDGSGTSYNPGAVYSANSGTTLFAIWKANTYTITFNANGGYIPVTVNGTTTNNVSITKTKTYGVNLSVPTATRPDYSFLGWSTSNTATTATYTSAKPYTANAAATLYAVWSLDYQKPRVKIKQIHRGVYDTATGVFNYSDDGKDCRFVADVATDKDITAMKADVYDSSGTLVKTGSWTNFTNFTKILICELESEKSYRLEFTVTDGGGSSTATVIIPSVKYIIDIRKGGTGIAFNKTAELEGVCDIGFQTKFTGGIKNEQLTKAVDLDTLLTPNTYVSVNKVTYTNMPPGLTGTFTLEVLSAGAEEQVMQRVTRCIQGTPYEYVRHYYATNGVKSWRPWVRKFGVSLYDNTAGSTGTIALTDGKDADGNPIPALLSNFKIIEIYYADNVNTGGGYTKIRIPDGKTIELHCIEASGAENTYIRRTRYTLSGSNITPIVDTAAYVTLYNQSDGTGGLVGTHNAGVNRIEIQKVVGYEYDF